MSQTEEALVAIGSLLQFWVSCILWPYAIELTSFLQKKALKKKRKISASENPILTFLKEP
ncbi:MAG: hypothetical protein OEZ34_03650 [Spirochaetia bacterium]|nr:hypothetical protein [Spirochaetia bacterium]